MEQSIKIFRDAEKAILEGRLDLANAYLTIVLDHSPEDVALHERALQMKSKLLLQDKDYFEEPQDSKESTWRKISLERVLADEDFNPPPDPKSPTDALSVPVRTPHRNNGGNKIILLSSWLLLLFCLGGVIGVVTHPEAIDNLMSYRQLADPLETARLEYAQGNIQVAKEQAHKALELNHPRTGSLLLLLAQIAEKEKSTADFRVYSRRLMRESTASWEDVLGLARILKEKGDASAEVAFQIAYQKGPPVENWLEIGQAFQSFGRDDSAISLYKAVVRRGSPQDSIAAASLLISLGEQ